MLCGMLRAVVVLASAVARRAIAPMSACMAGGLQHACTRGPGVMQDTAYPVMMHGLTRVGLWGSPERFGPVIYACFRRENFHLSAKLTHLAQCAPAPPRDRG